MIPMPHPRFLSVALSAVLLLAPPGAVATTYSWKSAADGAWNNAANWQPSGVPGPGDTALVNAIGTYTVRIADNTTVAALEVGGAGGSASLLVDGRQLVVTNGASLGGFSSLVLSNAALAGKTLTVSAGATLVLDAASVNYLQGISVVNQGTVQWNRGQVRLSLDALVQNWGTWNAAPEGLLYGESAGGGFVNHSKFRKPAGAGTTYVVNVPFVNDGLVDALSGTLRFEAHTGTTNLVAGVFQSAAGATVELGYGTFADAGGRFTGAGTARFAGSQLVLRTNLPEGLRIDSGSVLLGPGFQAGSVTNLHLAGAALAGTNTVSGVLVLTNGTMAGAFTVLPSGQLGFDGNNVHGLHGLQLLNHGTVAWHAGQVRLGYGTVVTNAGLWTTDTDNYLLVDGGVCRFVNGGSLEKTANAGTTGIGVPFQNPGTVRARAGTLAFTAPFGETNVLAGAFVADANAGVDLSSGDFADGGAVFSGDGRATFSGTTLLLPSNTPPGLVLNRGTLRLGPAFQGGTITNLSVGAVTIEGTNRLSGLLAITNATIKGDFTVLPTGTLRCLGTSVDAFYGSRLLNQGLLDWRSGQIRVGYGLAFTNAGQLVATTDNAVVLDGGTARVVNTGLFRKDADKGYTVVSGIDFVNQGTVQAKSGIISFSAPFGGTNALGGAWAADAGAAIELNGGDFVDGGGAFTGPGRTAFIGGRLILPDNTIPGLTVAGANLQLGPGFQGGSISNLALGAATLSGTNAVSGLLVLTNSTVTGRLLVQPSGTVRFVGTSVHGLYGQSFENHGTVDWRAGQVRLGYGVAVTNAGLWTTSADNYLLLDGGTALFVNGGTFRKTANNGYTGISGFPFNNQGVVDVQAGILAFYASPTGTNGLSGQFTTAAGATVQVGQNAFVDAGATFAGAGVSQFLNGSLLLPTNAIPGLSLDGGTVALGAAFQKGGTITNLVLNAAALVGTNTVDGLLTLRNSRVRDQLTVSPAGRLVIAGNSTMLFDGTRFLNRGMVEWQSGQVRAGGGAVLTNAGEWRITCDSALVVEYGTAQFVNQGSLRKLGTPGYTSVVDPFGFSNPGLVEIASGYVQFPSSVTNPAGTIRLSGGTPLGSPAFLLTGGRLEGTGSLGDNQLVSGTVAPGGKGFGVLAFNNALNLRAGTTLSLDLGGTNAGVDLDQLVVSGQATLDNPVLQVASAADLPQGTRLVIVSNRTHLPVVGTFAGLPDRAVFQVGRQLFRIRYNDGTAKNVVLVRDDGLIHLSVTSFATTNASFQFGGLGTNAATYEVQTSTNLVDWTSVGFFPANASGLFGFGHTNADKGPYRFFRAYGPGLTEP